MRVQYTCGKALNANMKVDKCCHRQKNEAFALRLEAPMLGVGARIDDERGDGIRLMLGVETVVLINAVEHHVESGRAGNSPGPPPPAMKCKQARETML
jgi:hypothetical protein